MTAVHLENNKKKEPGCLQDCFERLYDKEYSVIQFEKKKEKKSRQKYQAEPILDQTVVCGAAELKLIFNEENNKKKATMHTKKF